MKANQTTDTTLQENFEAGHVCWDDKDIVNGRPTGAVRFSFGYASRRRDVPALVTFLRRSFLQEAAPQPSKREAPSCSASPVGDHEAPLLAEIWVYPIKSCRGCSLSEWPLGENGLLYDREWVIVGEDDAALTLKSVPQLGLIQPAVDLERGRLESLQCCSGRLCLKARFGRCSPTSGLV